MAEGGYGGSGAFSSFNPQQFFGGAPASAYGQYSGNPFDRSGETNPKKVAGSGLGGLPGVFEGWDAAARYSFAPAGEFYNKMQPIADFFGQQRQKNIGAELFGTSAEAIDTQFGEAKRQQTQGLTRAGMSGGSAVSPLASMALQQEAQARSGAFGTAARQAVLQAEAFQAQAARDEQNTLSSIMQAMLVPAQIQAARASNAPLGSVGPSLLGPGLGALGGFMNMMGQGG